MTSDYEAFLRAKQQRHTPSGFEAEISGNLFQWQQAVTKWALKQGRAALFEDCGLGKTGQQLVWGNEVSKKTEKPVLILAPLAVSLQTKREGEKFGVEVNVCETQEDVKSGVNITNYEKLERFDTSVFSGVVLDESSILKSFNGATKQMIIERFAKTPYKLSCTATPSPNDIEELGNQAEFLGVMKRREMLSMFFVHDGGETSKWRLKGHAKDRFWEWVSSWAVVVTKPSDLGYEDGMFILPPVEYIQHSYTEEIYEHGDQLSLMPVEILTLNDRRAARRATMAERVKIAADLVNQSNEQWIVWCDLNSESEALKHTINESVEVKGSDTAEHKTSSAIEFANGNIKCLVSKPSIFGWGLNWQNCRNMIFVGLSDSFEQFYQAVRRCWRFGQMQGVNVHIVISEREGAVLDNINRKERQSKEMITEMVKYSKNVLDLAKSGVINTVTTYIPTEDMQIPQFMKGA